MMKKSILLFLGFIIPTTLLGADSVSVPWEEFKRVYEESVTRKALEKAGIEEQPLIYNIGKAAYHLTIFETHALGRLSLSGEIISGKPGMISLFDNKLVIKDVINMTGGALLWDPGEADKMIFRPDGTKHFKLSLTFFASIEEDRKSRFVRINIPMALKNSLGLELSPGIRLIESPGILDVDGNYLFPARPSLLVRFSDESALTATPVVQVDTLSRIQLQGSKIIIATHFVPLQPLLNELKIKLPANATYISSSLKSSSITRLKGDMLQLNLSPQKMKTFSITIGLGQSQSVKDVSFLLPAIVDNNGQQGSFILDQPDEGQLSLVGKFSGSRIPVSRLHSTLQTVAGNRRYFVRIPPNEEINLSIRRFKTLQTPPVVIDDVSFYTSFDDNGSILSVLIMDVPSEAGAHLRIRQVPNTEIWYLKINGENRKVYADRTSTNKGTANNAWVIPLAGHDASHVELAFISRGEKLKLNGHLEMVLPETNLPARSVRIGIALPERLQILSLDGPISPAPESVWETPQEFIGKPYYFSSSFYRGEKMKIAIYYKEPVK
jgi:hypothetical protein